MTARPPDLRTGSGESSAPSDTPSPGALSLRHRFPLCWGWDLGGGPVAPDDFATAELAAWLEAGLPLTEAVAMARATLEGQTRTPLAVPPVPDVEGSAEAAGASLYLRSVAKKWMAGTRGSFDVQVAQGAISVAMLAGMPLTLAAIVQAVDARYFALVPPELGWTVAFAWTCLALLAVANHFWLRRQVSKLSRLDADDVLDGLGAPGSGTRAATGWHREVEALSRSGVHAADLSDWSLTRLLIEASEGGARSTAYAALGDFTCKLLGVACLACLIAGLLLPAVGLHLR